MIVVHQIYLSLPIIKVKNLVVLVSNLTPALPKTYRCFLKNIH